MANAGKKATKKIKSQDSIASTDSHKRKNNYQTYLKYVVDEKTGKSEVHFKKNTDWFYMGSHDLDVLNNTVTQITRICGRGDHLNSKDKLLMANASLASIREIKPQDSVELMLACQMVTVHNIALEMSSRAMLADQTFDGVNANINRVTKLMRTYTAQIEALTKYRNKGKQQITVKHQNVNVNDGGQAVIGDINKGGGNG